MAILPAAAARQNDERLKPMTRQVSVIVMSAGACLVMSMACLQA